MKSPAMTPKRVDTRARRAEAAIGRLVRIMDTLRSPTGGCPWDRAQTHQTLRAHIVEETYEVLDAIDRSDAGGLVEELGDVLFQCVFHAQLGAESGRFDLADAIAAISEKLIRRHPHVFTADGRPITNAARRAAGIRTPQAVKEQWEQIKARERGTGNAAATKRILSGVPTSMPALLRAHEVSRRAAAVGFDWVRPIDVVDKIEEEVRELREAVAQSPARAADELGDLLFSIANLARKLGLEPESALRQANDKFTERFNALEAAFEDRGASIHGATLAAMERAWQEIKSSSAQRARGKARGKEAAHASPRTSTSARSSSSPSRPRRRSR